MPAEHGAAAGRSCASGPSSFSKSLNSASLFREGQSIEPLPFKCNLNAHFREADCLPLLSLSIKLVCVQPERGRRPGQIRRGPGSAAGPARLSSVESETPGQGLYNCLQPSMHDRAKCIVRTDMVRLALTGSDREGSILFCMIFKRIIEFVLKK